MDTTQDLINGYLILYQYSVPVYSELDPEKVLFSLFFKLSFYPGEIYMDSA